MAKIISTKASLTADRVAKLKKEDPEKYAALPDEGAEITIDYNVGDNLDQTVEIFGADVVQKYFFDHVKFSMAERARKLLAEKIAQGMSVEEAQEAVQAAFYNPATDTYEWKPRLVERKDEIEKQVERLSKLSPEKRAEEIARLKEMLASME